MKWTGGIEAMIGRALARSHPWLFKLKRLPDAGLPDFCLAWHSTRALNDDSFGERGGGSD